MNINKNLELLTNDYNSFAEFLEFREVTDKSNEPNDLKTLIGYCNQRIGFFQRLYTLENRLKEQLIKTDNSSLQYKMDYIKAYYNNHFNLEGIIKETVDVKGNKVELYILTEKQNKVSNYSKKFILYDKDTKALYYGYTTLIENGSNFQDYYTILGDVYENLKVEPYLTLLNDLYFKILSSQPDTTSASKEPIEPIPILPVIAEKVSNLNAAGKTLANEFRRIAASIQTQNPQPTTPPTGGSKKPTYKLNGEKVVLLHKNKKVQRSIYVKGNGKTKYCKIDHQYILLSKLKNKIQ